MGYNGEPAVGHMIQPTEIQHHYSCPIEERYAPLAVPGTRGVGLNSTTLVRFDEGPHRDNPIWNIAFATGDALTSQDTLWLCTWIDWTRSMPYLLV